MGVGTPGLLSLAVTTPEPLIVFPSASFLPKSQMTDNVEYLDACQWLEKMAFKLMFKVKNTNQDSSPGSYRSLQVTSGCRIRGKCISQRSKRHSIWACSTAMTDAGTCAGTGAVTDSVSSVISFSHILDGLRKQ